MTEVKRQGLLNLDFGMQKVEYVEPISKMSFGPISLLVPGFKSSIRLGRTFGLRPTRRIRSDGESRNAGKLGSAAILSQNPIFEMGSDKARGPRPEDRNDSILFCLEP
jgi:hypothetical protein